MYMVWKTPGKIPILSTFRSYIFFPSKIDIKAFQRFIKLWETEKIETCLERLFRGNRKRFSSFFVYLSKIESIISQNFFYSENRCVKKIFFFNILFSKFRSYLWLLVTTLKPFSFLSSWLGVNAEKNDKAKRQRTWSSISHILTFQLDIKRFLFPNFLWFKKKFLF